MKNKPTDEQKKILENQKKNLVVSASAGSGKTFVVIEYLINLICNKKIPLSKILVLTFTKAAANEIKTRLYKEILNQKQDEFLMNQLDEIALSDISTIDSFCEKIIKRNVHKLDINENFAVLDEKVSKNLKLTAFNKAFEKFSKENEEHFDKIYFSFKKNSQQIFETLLSFQAFFDSSFSGGELCKNFRENSFEYVKKAEDYLIKYIRGIQNTVKKEMKNFENISPKLLQFKNELLSFCEIKYSNDFIDFINKLKNFKMPTLPRENSEEKEFLSEERDKLKDLQKISEYFNDSTDFFKKSIYDNSLANALIDLYLLFDKEYKSLKEEKSGLDFADLEKYAKILLKDEEFEKHLQNQYEYIFIDEYQDTNSLQESIIKPIANKGFFMAVGDPKQGIYGFRNASMEIMKKDIEEFSKIEDGEALFLTGNFRSDERVLTFINKIFEKVMTNETVGFDYQKTSLLKGLQTFEKGNFPSVCVDIISKKKKEKTTPIGIYSVKEDNIEIEEDNKDEVLDIADRIESLLESKIYDAKNKCFRKVEQGDIALLFRGRDKLMQNTVKFLQEKGFNIQADIKQDLLDDGEIRVILSLLKITCDFDDEISLVSVMNSWFGGFSIDEIVKLSQTDKIKKIYENAKESSDEKIVNFKKSIEEFYFNCQVLGLTNALHKYYSDKNYFMYLNSLDDANIKKGHINELFRIIKSGDFDFNLYGLINYLENVKTEGQISEQASNAISISTIHATKGLEYPIVILAGAGEKLSKPYTKPYLITSEFGVGTYLYDFDNNNKIASLPFVAGKLFKKKKEFIDELMIFYVALTRAQNNLIVIGTQNCDNFKLSNNVFSYNTYIDIILNAFGENVTEKLLESGQTKAYNCEFRIIDEDAIESKEIIEKIVFEKFDIEDKAQEIEKYIDKEYKDKDECCFAYKNSVSSVLHLNEEGFIETKNQENSMSREKAILQGNAYHEALKVLPFEKINSFDDLKRLDKYLIECIGEEYFNLIDFELLYKNISLIKQTVNNGKPIKEKEFIMETTLKEIGISNSDKKVIVQGIVDLFCMGEKNVLIDYKFSSEKDENILINRYKKQIELYQLAIEKAFDKKVDERYILSLKNADLIKI